MKILKKTLALLLVAMLVLSLSATAFAAATDKFTYSGADATTDGKITVSNAVVGEAYTLYKVLDATFTGDSVAYTIKDGALKTYLETNGTDYFTIGTVADANGNYSVERAGTMSGSNFTPTKSDDELIAFVKGIPTSNFTEIGKIDEASATSISFEKIPYGYYYMTSSLGSLVTIDSNKPTESIQEKNSIPGDEKKVDDSASAGDQWGTSDDAQIGDTVRFQITVTDGKGTDKDIVVHDVMSAGLTLDTSSFVVKGPKYIDDDNDPATPDVKTAGQTLTAAEYELKTTGLSDSCTFEIVLKATYVATLDENDAVTIDYSAVLNNNAVVGTPENNKSTIEYSEQHETNPHEVTVNTYSVELTKYDASDASKNPIAGAKFQIQDSAGNPIWLTNGTAKSGYDVYEVLDTTKLTAVMDGTKVIGWKDGETPVTAFTDFTTTADKKVQIDGLDNKKAYKLEEIEAPAGYNKLQNKVDLTVDSTTKLFDSQEIANNKGTELPSTGGIGTTIFYVVGGVLVLAALVMLITKKRMSTEG